MITAAIYALVDGRPHFVISAGAVGLDLEGLHFLAARLSDAFQRPVWIADRRRVAYQGDVMGERISEAFAPAAHQGL